MTFGRAAGAGGAPWTGSHPLRSHRTRLHRLPRLALPCSVPHPRRARGYHGDMTCSGASGLLTASVPDRVGIGVRDERQSRARTRRHAVRVMPDERSLSPAARAIAYGIVGCAMESAFTSARLSRESRSVRASGPATPWMLPIYALALPLFEPVHDGLRDRPAWVRATAYAAGIMAVEGGTGWILRRRTGRCPWDYTGRTRWHVSGLVRLDYGPLWALAGLATERLHDAMTGAARAACATIGRRGPVAQR